MQRGAPVTPSNDMALLCLLLLLWEPLCRQNWVSSLFPEHQAGPWLMFTVAEGRLLASDPWWGGAGGLDWFLGPLCRVLCPPVGTVGQFLAGPKGEQDVLPDPESWFQWIPQAHKVSLAAAILLEHC